MLMTEERARHRPCVGGPWAGALASNSGLRTCEGSRCLAWRWARTRTGDVTDKIAEIKRHRQETGASLKEAVDWWNMQPASGDPRGYCGLAGAPTS